MTRRVIVEAIEKERTWRHLTATVEGDGVMVELEGYDDSLFFDMTREEAARFATAMLSALDATAPA